MIQGKIVELMISVPIALAIAIAVRPTQAGSAGNGTAGNGLPQFKSLSLFRNEADAQKQCPADTVVWGSSAHIGVYFVKGAGPQRIAGYYACMADAKKAGYQIGE